MTGDNSLLLALAQLNPTVGDLRGNCDKIIAVARHCHAELGADILALPEQAIIGYPAEDLLLQPYTAPLCMQELARVKREIPPELCLIVGYPRALNGGGGAAATGKRNAENWQALETAAADKVSNETTGAVTEAGDGRVAGAMGADDRRVTNHLEVCLGGASLLSYAKQLLPSYQVFDEPRFFVAGSESGCFTLKGMNIGVLICEDLWQSGPAEQCRALGTRHIISINASPYSVHQPQKRYGIVAARARETGVSISYTNCAGGQDELVFDGNSFACSTTGEIMQLAPPLQEHVALLQLNRDGSIEAKGGAEIRQAPPRPPNSIAAAEQSSTKQPPYTASATHSPAKHSGATAPASDSESLPPVSAEQKKSEEQPSAAGPPTRLDIGDLRPPPSSSPRRTKNAEIYQVIQCGLRDYVYKNNFKQVVLGLSGGIDSALVACLAADALGAERVTALMLATKYTSNDSIRDAEQLAKNLGINYEFLAIDKLVAGAHELLAPLIDLSDPEDLAAQNIQPRLRALLLMALANKHNALLLATSNKSEVAVGYSTLYGDMAGGFAPLKDVFKQRVYELANYRNKLAGTDGDGKGLAGRGKDGGRGKSEAGAAGSNGGLKKVPAGKNSAGVIPQHIIRRPPSAELYEGQEDRSNLPDYEVLDRILQLYIEEGEDYTSMLRQGVAEATTLARVIRMVDAAEYKRRQAAPGVRISEYNFGRDRRYPITNKFAQQTTKL